MTPVSQTAPSPADNLRGIGAMIAAQLFFTLNDTCTKLVAEHLPASQIMAVRGVMAVGLVFGIAWVNGGLRELHILGRPLVLLRSAVDAVIAFGFITALPHLPLADITVILQATPLVLTAMSATILRETVGWRRWAAVLAGFAGVVIVVQPTGAGGLSLWALIAVGVSVLIAVRDLLTRALGPGVPSFTATIGSTVAVAILGLAGGITDVWDQPALWEVGLLALAAILVTLATQTVIVAFRNVEVSAVSPFCYAAIVWATIMGWLVWGQTLEPVSWAGAALIVGSGLYTFHREALRRRPR